MIVVAAAVIVLVVILIIIVEVVVVVKMEKNHAMLNFRFCIPICLWFVQ